MKRQWMGRSLGVQCLGVLLLGVAGARPAAALSPGDLNPEPAGVVVEEVERGFAAHKAGLEPGDVLLRWRRAASLPANPESASGDLSSPFDLDEVELEQASRGELTVTGMREGEPLLVRLLPGAWKIQTRPRLMAGELASYDEAKALIAKGEIDKGLSVWKEMAAATGRVGNHAKAAWLFLRGADSAVESREWQIAAGALKEAQREARASGKASLVATITDKLASFFLNRNEFQRASAAYQEALEIRQASSSTSLGTARSLNNLGIVAWYRGDLASAADYFQRSLAIRERFAPQSLDVAFSLNNLGLVATNRGYLATAEAFLRRALAIEAKLVPQSIDVSMNLNNLGNVVADRGDLAAAKDYYRRSLAIQEKLAPQSLEVATSLGNLGFLASDRGDLASAEDFSRRSLAIMEKLAPRSVTVAGNLLNLGHVAFERKDFVSADSFLRRSYAMYEELAPRSVNAAETLRQLGDVALARSHLSSAETHYERSLAIRRERAPGSAFEAESCQRLAALHRRRRQLKEALAYYDCAVEALEAQKGKLGGSDEARSGFGAKVAGTYREAIDLLVEVGKTEEAFHLLERYRARELLALLAERDLVFSSDIPEELEGRRHTANQIYDRAFGRWMQLSDQAGAEERQQAREELEEVRRRQDEIRAEIRAASPRLAALQDPQPLDLTAAHAALDPGTLLLSYSIGEKTSYLFAVGPQRGAHETELRVFPLAAGEESLRDEVERFREALGRGQFDRRPKKVLLLARRLSELLLAPISGQIGQAERLLILADGPLHSLPFAALADPGAIDGRRFLVEAKPIHHAASATVFALLKQERRERRATRLAAFGDPRYPATAPRDANAAPQLRAALRGGFELTPLPATRGEVESLRRLYPQASRIYLGAEATEGRAKAVGTETTHLHIASHGLLNDRFPLDSALAFSIPSHRREGEDNGLLQAWEIFEQVRIDADLVTLSACDTGLGKVLGGEGLLGLTRAFQYAGARSVLASLWSVSDASTGELMKRFYGYLKAGQSKADALRGAQLDLLRSTELSHPFHWAGFELIGDWR